MHHHGIMGTESETIAAGAVAAEPMDGDEADEVVEGIGTTIVMESLKIQDGGDGVGEVPNNLLLPECLG